MRPLCAPTPLGGVSAADAVMWMYGAARVNAAPHATRRRDDSAAATDVGYVVTWASTQRRPTPRTITDHSIVSDSAKNTGGGGGGVYH